MGCAESRAFDDGYYRGPAHQRRWARREARRQRRAYMRGQAMYPTTGTMGGRGTGIGYPYALLGGMSAYTRAQRYSNGYYSVSPRRTIGYGNYGYTPGVQRTAYAPSAAYGYSGSGYSPAVQQAVYATSAASYPAGRFGYGVPRTYGSSAGRRWL